ncbi:MAG: hypothetical protein PSV13_20710 [Lacunisphaera sp.]|nr:hypothetical protein [Lacunisphaera sp.]
MKNIRIILALALASFFATALVNAEEAKKEETKAKCCMKAEKAGEKCTHECCTAAAKDSKACEKCAPKKTEEKK